MATTWNAAAAALAIIAGVLAVVAAQEDLYQPRPPCAQAVVEGIVRDAVNREFSNNNQITAGFLRVFFHDCFSRGCDASILLDGEWNAGPNAGSVQKRVRELVNEIRRTVNQACGDNSVSCADILALATRDSVVAAKGPKVNLRLGRFDSKTPGSTDKLPGPSFSVPQLLSRFAEFQLSAADLVALSGGHTVGKASCGFIRRNDDFSRNLAQQCPRNPDRKQSLDVVTPNEFDNGYYVALTRGQGIFESDQGLAGHPQTAGLVRSFASNKQIFFDQWAASFAKLSNINWLTQQNGEIRTDCTRPRGRINSIINDTVASF